MKTCARLRMTNFDYPFMLCGKLCDTILHYCNLEIARIKLYHLAHLYRIMRYQKLVFNRFNVMSVHCILLGLSSISQHTNTLPRFPGCHKILKIERNKNLAAQICDCLGLKKYLFIYVGETYEYFEEILTDRHLNETNMSD